MQAEAIHRARFIRLISVGGAATDEPTAATAAYSAYILRKLQMTSLLATSTDNVNNGSKASGKAESISRLHPPLTTHRKKWHPLR